MEEAPPSAQELVDVCKQALQYSSTAHHQSLPALALRTLLQEGLISPWNLACVNEVADSVRARACVWWRALVAHTGRMSLREFTLPSPVLLPRRPHRSLSR